MDFDVFFSIADARRRLPAARARCRQFFAQVEAADRLGFGTADHESHLSSEIQKRHRQPVILHWQARPERRLPGWRSTFFQRTRCIEPQRGDEHPVQRRPVAAAERIAAFCTLHGPTAEHRRIHVGLLLVGSIS
jgi:hypothetical protein